MSRRILLAAVVAAALLIATGCGKFGSIAGDTSGSTSTNGDQSTLFSAAKFDAAAKKASGCGDVSTDSEYGRNHVKPGTRISYKLNPPSSGTHWETGNKSPIKWGVYTTEQRDEAWIQNLEQGQLVVAYKGLTPQQVTDMASVIHRNPYHITVFPRKANPKAGVYYLAWTHTLYCKRPSSEALQYMADKYIDAGPELITDDPGKDA